MNFWKSSEGFQRVRKSSGEMFIQTGCFSDREIQTTNFQEDPIQEAPMSPSLIPELY